MCRIYVNFHTTLRKVVSVLTGDYCSTYSKIVKEVRPTSPSKQYFFFLCQLLA